MAGVFISYRREDTSGEANHLASDLVDELGRANVFIDIDTISPGVDFERRIDEALTTCDVVLVLIGDRWLTSRTRRADAASTPRATSCASRSPRRSTART